MCRRQIEIKHRGEDLCRAQHCSYSIINSDGFTLIELLVVIATIALVMAVFVLGGTGSGIETSLRRDCAG